MTFNTSWKKLCQRWFQNLNHVKIDVYPVKNISFINIYHYLLVLFLMAAMNVQLFLSISNACSEHANYLIHWIQ